MKTRRDFLKIGSLAVIGGLMLAGGQVNFAQKLDDKGGYFPVPAVADISSSFRATTFEPLINTVFEVSQKSSAKNLSIQKTANSLRLLEIIPNDQAIAKSTVNIESFTLIFAAEGKGKLADKIYDVSHPVLGNFQIFLSAVGKSEKNYQAVFCRVYF